MSRWLLSGLLLFVVAPTYACRCAERDLQDYFAAARQVAVGRLAASRDIELADGRTVLELEFELLAPLYKPVAVEGPQQGSRQSYRTAISSAACGIPAETGAVYLLFANADETDDALMVDSCSGTRVHLPADRSAPVGFRDVPPRFVMQQLNGLAGLDVLERVASRHPDVDDANNTTMIGLLDVASLAHTGFARLYARPDTNSPLVAEFNAYEQVRYLEVSYESPAALVFARRDDWFRLQLDDGRFGWLPPEFSGRFFAYDDLPVRRLAYVRAPWHGFLWPSPGAGLPVRSTPPAGFEQPVEVFESQRIGGSLWFRVGILNANPCDGGESSVTLGGWTPAYDTVGEPLIWFYSRGC